jgi:hypothetical protein
MNNLGIRQNLMKAGSRRIVQDSKKRSLNLQDLKIIKGPKDELPHLKCTQTEFPLPEQK